MSKVNLLKTGSALAVVLHIALTPAFANLDKETKVTVTQPKYQSISMENFVADNDSLLGKSLSESIVLDDEDDAASTLAKLKKQSEEKNSNLDKAIKGALVAGGAAAGVGLAWVYGPYLAFTATYKASMTLFSLANPNASWFALNFIAMPVATDLGITAATNPLTQAAIGAAGTAAGYVIGKGACNAYDAAKNTVSWIYSKVFG